MTERFERGTHRQRAQIRSADADVDNVGNDLVGIAQPASAADFVCKFAHTLQNAVDFGHHIFTVNHNRRIGAVAKGDMQDGAVFGGIDFFAVEHLPHPLRHACFTRQLEQ